MHALEQKGRVRNVDGEGRVQFCCVWCWGNMGFQVKRYMQEDLDGKTEQKSGEDVKEMWDERGRGNRKWGERSGGGMCAHKKPWIHLWEHIQHLPSADHQADEPKDDNNEAKSLYKCGISIHECHHGKEELKGVSEKRDRADFYSLG